MKPDNVKRILHGLTMVLIGLLGLALIAFFFLAMAGITTFGIRLPDGTRLSKWVGVVYLSRAIESRGRIGV